MTPGSIWPAPRSHRKSIECGKTHRALDAASAVYGAHRGAAPQMRDDDPSVRDFGRDVRQGLRDIFIGETVKSVAPDPFIVQPTGYGVVVRDLVMVAVKGRIEAGDLRQCGKIGKQGADRRQIMRLMQRRQRREALQTRDYAMVDQHGPIIIRTAMHDPMADGKRT